MGLAGAFVRRVHVFESRKDTFRDDQVLQESIITCARRTTRRPKTVSISSSFGRDMTDHLPSTTVSYETAIDDATGHMFVRVPENPLDVRLISVVESWPGRFIDHGLRVSTGPVVMFRAKKFLLDSADVPSAVPLLCVHNVRPFETVWPLSKNGKPTAFKACPESRRLLVPARNYVLLRRFSAKEERRRLTASCFLRASAHAADVALENHLNYVYHANRELTENEVYGLAALFNSALLDRHFRMVSGNTQVNATELRSMHVPDLGVVAHIGSRVRALPTVTVRAAEEIVVVELGISGALRTYLKEFAV